MDSMRNMLVLALVLMGLVPLHADAEPSLPLPRFASLKTDEANIRTGPGLRYPIKWVIKRRDMPVEITGEFEQWREIRDMQGEKGWVHRSMLSGRRTAIVRGKEQLLYGDADMDSSPIARLQEGVIARLLECNAEMCRLRIDSFKGWIPRTALWGLYTEEVIE